MNGRGFAVGLLASLLLAACAVQPAPPADRVVIRPEPPRDALTDRAWRAWRLADRTDFLRCRLEDGRVRFGHSWKRIEPKVFVVMRGQTRRIRVLRADGRRGRWLWVRHAGNGRRLRLCTVPPDDAPRSRCIRLLVDDRRAFDRGVSAVLSARRGLRQVMLRCRWPRRKPPFELVFGADPDEGRRFRR